MIIPALANIIRRNSGDGDFTPEDCFNQCTDYVTYKCVDLNPGKFLVLNDTNIAIHCNNRIFSSQPLSIEECRQLGNEIGEEMCKPVMQREVLDEDPNLIWWIVSGLLALIPIVRTARALTAVGGALLLYSLTSEEEEHYNAMDENGVR